MHTHTRHRHFVALPVFALAIVAILTLDRAQFSMASVTESGESIVSTYGLTIRAGSGAVFQMEEERPAANVMRGEAYVRSERYGTIAVAGATVHLFHATAYVSPDAHTTDIVALDAPVLVEYRNATLVPRGYLLRIASGSVFPPTPVPSVWLRDRATVLRQFAVTATRASSSAVQSDEHVFIDARKRSAQALSLPIDELTITDAQMLLDLAAASSSTPAVLPYISLVLATRSQFPETYVLLADIMSSATDAQGYALALMEEGLARKEPLPDAFAPLFGSFAGAATARNPERAVILSSLLDRYLSAFPETSFPKTMRAWHAERDHIAGVHAVLHPQRAASVSSVVSSASSSVSQEMLTNEEAIFRTRNVLRDMSAIFTVDTRIEHASQPNHVAVHDIVLAGPQSLTRVDFVYDALSGVAHAIVMNGERMPNTMPLTDLAAMLH